MAKLAFVLSHSGLPSLGLPNVKGHQFCPCCGSALVRELTSRLAAFALIEGTLHGPICRCCRDRWCPTFDEIVRDDDAPNPFANRGPTLSSLLDRKPDEAIGYVLCPLYIYPSKAPVPEPEPMSEGQ